MNTVATKLVSLGRASTAELLGPDASLPVAPAQLQAAMAAIYHAAVEGTPRRELLQMICIQLAEQLAVPLVMLVRKVQNGSILVEATSSEGALWLAFNRIPERWDGGVTSQGPANVALRANEPVRLSFVKEPLALWAEAAQQDRVNEVIAWPVALPNSVFVLEVFSSTSLGAAYGRSGTAVHALTHGLITLLTDLERIERQRLLSHALESAGNAAFITDANATIQWSNAAFSALTGHAAQDVLGRNPSLLHSGKQSVRYYRDMWSTIRSGNVWSGETVDRDKDGNLYTIRQTVSPIVIDGRITNYISIHEDVTGQKRRQQALERATGVDQRTGLMTQAAFEAAARDAMSTLSAQHNGVDLILISLRGLRRASASFDTDVEEFLSNAMGRRVREVIPAPHLAGATGAYEYAALISDDQLAGNSPDNIVEDLLRSLSEPLLYLGDSLNVDAHCVRATYPADGASFDEVWAKADRKLADEPTARPRRSAISRQADS